MTSDPTSGATPPTPTDGPGRDGQRAPAAATAAARPGSRRRHAAVLAALTLVGAVLAAVLGPDPRLGEAHAGDPRLAAQTRAIVGDGRGIPALAVAHLEGGKTTFAGFGDVAGAPPTPETPFELGSITKTFTGHLLAIGVERRELALDDPLSRHLPELAGTPAGAATLRQLATHTSGLPRLPAGMSPLGAFSGGNPYAGWSTARVIDAARQAPVTGVGDEAYSNLGVALLGHAEERAAGAPSWTRLVTDRLLAPLGMTHTVIVPEGGAEPAGLATPHWSNGRAVAPWEGEGFAPAGVATRTTARDLATFAAAVLDGTAPGAAAATPITGEGRRRSGLGWVVDDTDTGTVTWHNGGTGGSSTMLALDVAGKRGALALASSAASVDEVAVGLLRGDTTPIRPPRDGLQLVALAVGVIGLVSLLWRLARRPSRVSLATGVVEAATGLVLAWVLGPWGSLSGWVLGALAGAVAGGTVLAARAALTAPNLPGRRAGSAVVSLVLSVALAGLVVLAVS